MLLNRSNAICHLHKMYHCLNRQWYTLFLEDFLPPKNQLMTNRFFSVKFILGIGFLSLLAAFSCTDPITVGSDLLGGDRASIGYNGSLEIDLRTFADDSLRVFAEENNQSTDVALFGTIEDPIFGKTTANVYLIPDLPRLGGLIDIPSFAGVGSDTVSIDSIVLIFTTDTSFFYGNVTGNSFPYQVNELMGEVDLDQDIYSRQDFPINPVPVATGTFTPTSSLTFLHDTMFYDSILVRQVRVKFDDALVDKFIGDGSGLIYASDTAFRQFFNGLYLQSTGVSNSLLGLNAIEEQSFGRLGLYFYTSQNNRAQDIYRIPMNVAAPNYRFDRTSSLAETLIAEQVSTNQQGLIQGGGGLTARIEITNLDDFAGKVINNAELDIFLKDLEGYSYTTYPAAKEVALYYRNDDGLFSRIADAFTLSSNTSNANRLFFLGGDLETDAGTNQQLYRVALSAHLQDMIRGEAEPFIYVRVNPLDSDGGRSIIYGPESTEFPMKLKVAFTEF